MQNNINPDILYNEYYDKIKKLETKSIKTQKIEESIIYRSILFQLIYRKSFQINCSMEHIEEIIDIQNNDIKKELIKLKRKIKLNKISKHEN